MSFIVETTPAPRPKTGNVPKVSVALAAVFIVLAVAQLYSYEDFPEVIASLWLPGGDQFAHILAALLVIAEVAAVPFLLMMRLSPAMRVISMVCGWLAVALWLTLSFWINLTVNAVTNSGVLGATIPLMPGWWMIGAFMAMGILVAWASWGLWPFVGSARDKTVR